MNPEGPLWQCHTTLSIFPSAGVNDVKNRGSIVTVPALGNRGNNHIGSAHSLLKQCTQTADNSVTESGKRGLLLKGNFAGWCSPVEAELSNSAKCAAKDIVCFCSHFDT